MDRFTNFTHLPYEIQNQILENAADTAVVEPRLAIVTLSLARNSSTRINGAHLHEIRPLRALLETGYMARQVALRTLARPPPTLEPSASSPSSPSSPTSRSSPTSQSSPSSSPSPASQESHPVDFIGVNKDDLSLVRATDIVYLRSGPYTMVAGEDLHMSYDGDEPFNYATALGLVVGSTYPNIMLDATYFDMDPLNGYERGELQRDTAPLAQSLDLLQRRSDWNNSLRYYADPRLLETPRVPQNLYFFLGPARNCSEFSHRGFSHAEPARLCMHFDQLDIIPADRIAEWSLDIEWQELLDVEKVMGFLEGWQQLGDRLPNFFFARVPEDRAGSAAEWEQQGLSHWFTKDIVHRLTRSHLDRWQHECREREANLMYGSSDDAIRSADEIRLQAWGPPGEEERQQQAASAWFLDVLLPLVAENLRKSWDPDQSPPRRAVMPSSLMLDRLQRKRV